MEKNSKKCHNEKAVGIDLGTTYTCIGIWNGVKDRVEILTNEQGNHTTPSMVAFTANESFIGQAAMNQYFSNPNNTVFDAKRLIGRKFSEPSVQSDMKLWPFSVINGPDEKPMIRVPYKDEKKDFIAEEISAMVLTRMKDISQDFLGCKVRKAVITVPAYFNNQQKEATNIAGKIAGLEVLRLLSEPTAAAIAYAHDNLLQIGKNFLVYDLGGGTFDVSIVHVNCKNNMVVKAVKGDTHLGGQDFDNKLVDHLVEEFKRKSRVDISGNHKALRRLKSVCERAKRELSHSVITSIEVPCIHEGVDLVSTISRAKFEQLNLKFLNKTIDLVDECIKDAKFNKNDISSIILVGGSSRIPKVQELLRDFFDNTTNICKDINPDEAVAYGAALMAAHLTGDYNSLAISDVTPLSLGIQVYGNIMCVIVPRNTPIPTRIEKNYSTPLDYLTCLSIDVYEGERPNTKDNVFLDKFTIDGIPSALKGVENVTVCMEIDRNGVLTVTATHNTTGNVRSLIVTRQFGSLSDSDIGKMKEEAERLRVEDQLWKEAALLKIQIADCLYDAEKQIENLVGTSSFTEAKQLHEFIKDCQIWLSENESVDKQTLEAKHDEIKTTCSNKLFDSL